MIFLYRKYFFVLIVIVFCCCYSISCTNSNKTNPQKIEESKPIVLERIRASKKMVAITDYNSTNYFVYRGEPMGYQFELLKSLANFLNVELEVKVSNDMDEVFDCLENGVCDLAALNLTVTKERSRRMLFTVPHTITRQVLVQRKPENWEKMSQQELEGHLIRNQIELGGQTIHLQKNTAFKRRVENLSEEIGDSIHIVELPDLESEELISLVAKGEIDYTVVDEIVALVNRTYHPEIDVKTAVSFPQNLAWAVKPDADYLCDTINLWLNNFKRTAKFRNIYNKYFRNVKSKKRIKSEYNSISGGKVSHYDDLIKTYSKNLGWDWRLLASLIYQESKFKHNVKSWAGAFGLMQLMPSTAERYGVDSLSSPEANIRAGVLFLKWLNEVFEDKVNDPEERIKFILAAYNVGLGHVLDARALARKNKKNPDIWTDNVDYYVLNKSDPKYYRDPVVKFGYCRGEEPYHYVSEILDRFHHYENVIE